MKKLNTKDVFKMARFLRNLDFKKEAETVLREADSIDDVFSDGYALIYAIFEKIVDKNAEEQFYEFLSGPYEMTAEEVGELSIGEQIKNIKQLAKENDLKVFIQDVKKLREILK